MNGIVPPQVLHPQVVTPQHIQNVMQIIAKTGDSQKLQAKIATLANQNKVQEWYLYQVVVKNF